MFARIMRLSLMSFILAGSMFGCGQPSEGTKQLGTAPQAAAPTFASAIQAEDLAGAWVAGDGKATVEKLPDGILKLVNDKGHVAHGMIAGGTLDCKEWSITGQLSSDKKVLHWSNGSTWHR